MGMSPDHEIGLREQQSSEAARTLKAGRFAVLPFLA